MVWRLTDGDNPDRASWYADWLLDPPSFRCCSGVKPVRSHLVHALVQLDRDHVEPGASGRWEAAYARGLSKRVAA